MRNAHQSQARFSNELLQFPTYVQYVQIIVTDALGLQSYPFQHPRVRYAACNAIGQMSTDFAPNFQKKFHAQIVPGLLTFLEDNENPRVQAHAGMFLILLIRL